MESAKAKKKRLNRIILGVRIFNLKSNDGSIARIKEKGSRLSIKKSLTGNKK